MNDLQNPNPDPREIWTKLSPGLKSLLTLGDSHSAIQQIAETPALLEEARQSLSALKADAEKSAGDDGVRRVVGRRLGLYPPMDMAPAAWVAWWTDYTDALGDLTETALEAGMKAWIRAPDSRFMPKPGELRDLARKTLSNSYSAYNRAHGAIQWQAQLDYAASRGAIVHVDPGPKPEPTEDEKAAVKKLLAEFKLKSPPRLQRPGIMPSHGRTDEFGLTAEMRERLGR